MPSCGAGTMFMASVDMYEFGENIEHECANARGHGFRRFLAGD
jgi:hypothetical protein